MNSLERWIEVFLLKLDQLKVHFQNLYIENKELLLTALSAAALFSLKEVLADCVQTVWRRSFARLLFLQKRNSNSEEDFQLLNDRLEMLREEIRLLRLKSEQAFSERDHYKNLWSSAVLRLEQLKDKDSDDSSLH